jgi:hypothetical protein
VALGVNPSAVRDLVLPTPCMSPAHLAVLDVIPEDLLAGIRLVSLKIPEVYAA